jgi:hypothetical protein
MTIRADRDRRDGVPPGSRLYSTRGGRAVTTGGNCQTPSNGGLLGVSPRSCGRSEAATAATIRAVTRRR